MASYRPDDARGELLRVRRDIANVENQLTVVCREVESASELGDKERVSDCRHIRNCLWKEKEQLRIQETIFLRILFSDSPLSGGSPLSLPSVPQVTAQQGSLQPDARGQQPFQQTPQQQLQPQQHHLSQLQQCPPMQACGPPPDYMQPQQLASGAGLMPPSLVPASPALKPSQPPGQGKSRRRMLSPPPGTPAGHNGQHIMAGGGGNAGGYENDLVNPEGYEVNRSSESKVVDVWTEWKDGINGGPSIEKLEEARKRDRKCVWWRHKNDYKYWSKQMRIIHAIEKKAVELNGNLEAAIRYWEEILRVEFEGSISKLREALGGEKAVPAGGDGRDGGSVNEMSSFKRHRKELLQKAVERMKHWPEQQQLIMDQAQQQQHQAQQQQLAQQQQMMEQQQQQQRMMEAEDASQGAVQEQQALGMQPAHPQAITQMS
eukprot:TRINITY_DN5157_c1_g1_i2.p1 TRINITY_DN5157_c1_g1~~TRINITY_DN5157_c1_g1_i2.p1  ORF type:complete len:432 (-),score=68.79 TRINITY_DN5157_c1_g1_i2:207-1502(-)